MTSPIEDLFGLSGKVAVVTGGAGGIGAGVAEVLAEAGATVAIVDRDREGAEGEAAKLTAAGYDASAFAADLGTEAAAVAVSD